MSKFSFFNFLSFQDSPPATTALSEHADDGLSAAVNPIARPDEVAAPFSLSIADLPGIVEGAAQNRFNAFDCLKHLEYSELIAMVVDVHGFQLDPNDQHK